MLGLLWGDAQRLPSPPLPPSGWRGHSLRRSSVKRSKRRACAWFLLLMIICLLQLNACVTLTSVSSVLGASASVTGAYFNYLSSENGETVIVTPPIVSYSASLQDRAADELEHLTPCARDTVVKNCSAIARMILDYGTLRQKIRAAKK